MRSFFSSASSSSSAQPLFDVERFRGERRRVALVRQVEHPTLVLGSTQPADLVAPDAVRERSVELVRRRGGGGAVYLEPGNHLWVDAWIPREDPLWTHDVSVAAGWAGRWWLEALSGPGASEARAFSIHTGRSVPGLLGELVCFASHGPGEVFDGDRKVVGLSQWRSREGALFSSCAYVAWDPRPLLDLLDFDEVARDELAGELSEVAVGLDALSRPVVDVSSVRARLVESFAGFEVEAGGTP